MKQITTFFSLCMLSLSVLFSQSAKLEISESFYKGGMAYLLGSAKSVDGNYHNMIMKGGLFSKPELVLLSYDKALKTKGEKTINMADLLPGEGTNNVQGCFYWNDSLYTLAANTDRKEKTKDLYLLKGDLNSTKLSKPKRLAHLEEVKTILFATDMTQALNYTFRTDPSPDNSKIMVSYLYDKGKKEAQTMLVQVWTEGFQTLLWEKNIEIPYNRANSIFNSINLDNDGNVYLAFNVRDGKKNLKRNSKYNIMRITQFGEEITSNTLDLGERTAKDLLISFDSNGDMLGSAYYYVKDDLIGIFMLRYPLSMKETPPLSYRVFDEDIDATKKRDPRFSKFMNTLHVVGKTDLNYVLQYAIPEENGDITLIGEDQYKLVKRKIGGSNTIETEYHFDDVIVTRVDKTGKILWVQHIPKRHQSDSPFTQYFSYSYVKSGKDYFIFYNDHIDNDLNSEAIKSFPTFKSKSVLAVVKVSETGELTREVISNFKEDDLYPYTRNCKQVSENEILIGIYKNGKFGTGKISLK